MTYWFRLAIAAWHKCVRWWEQPGSMRLHRGSESYHIGIQSLPLEWRLSQVIAVEAVIQYQADPCTCQGLKRKHLAVSDLHKEKLHKKHLSFLIRCLLAPSELSIYQEKCHCSPPSVHNTIELQFALISRVVQVAQLWEETSLLGINKYPHNRPAVMQPG